MFKSTPHVMPYQQHPSFEVPTDENVKVWRFMDFAKFVDLLETKALFFSRSDRFNDEFEGYYARGNRKWNPVLYKEKLNPQGIAYLTNQLEEHALVQRRYVFLNCWHLKDYESHGLWQLYSGERGIAIQSTYRRLRDSFNDNPENVFIGPVKYIDWDEDWIPTGNVLDPFVHKRKYFESENELRAVTFYDTNPENYVEFGKRMKVDLDTMIEAIYTSPSSQKWFYELVGRIVRRYDLDKGR
jgi:hypothetical protein